MRFYLIIAILALFFATNPSYSLYAADGQDELASGYITITDETGRIIFQTGRIVEVGDEFIDENNQLYEIFFVDGNSAKARAVKTEEDTAFLLPADDVQPVFSVDFKPYIAIYHTHTDECYIPHDGQSVRPGKGSIIKVGSVLADSLRAHGYEVIHSTALHDPHDANAYHRSRRTAVSLMKRSYPAAMFDVHRDSVPLKKYHTIIDGEEAAKILLVVGRQSQNRPMIQDFAKNIKAVADNMYPGLILGIFIARGNYNQDLTPRSILLEIGTQYNSLEAVKRSATLIADTIPMSLALANGTVSMADFNSSNFKPGDTSSAKLKPGVQKSSFLTWKHGVKALFLAAVIIGLGIYYLGFKKFLSRFSKRRN